MSVLDVSANGGRRILDNERPLFIKAWRVSSVHSPVGISKFIVRVEGLGSSSCFEEVGRYKDLKVKAQARIQTPTTDEKRH